MAVTKVDIYEACDKAIQSMNRENLKDFGRLKLAKWDEVNVIREVTGIYRRNAQRARKRYYEVAFEVFLLIMAMCDEEPKKSHKKAEKAITSEWIDKILEETDPVTLFRFNTETERKAYRLIEALEEAENKNEEIDKALRLWSRQLGQYAINVTDYAATQAYHDAGVEMVQWITQKDERVCIECHALDGRIFLIDEIPRKPHWGCRCFWKAFYLDKDD